MESKLFGRQKRTFHRRRVDRVRAPARRLVAERLEDRNLLAVLFEHGASDPVQVLVPLEADYDDLGFDWTGLAEPFDDSSWTTVTGTPNGVGYDRGSGAYDSAIGLDVEASMYEDSTTLFARAAFDVSDPSLVGVLKLRLRYDDGFIAWLNGQEIARANVTGSYPAWDARATAEYEAPPTPVEFDVSAFTSALQMGTNVLAIRLLNDSPTGDDALLAFTFSGENRIGPPLAVNDVAETVEGQPVVIDVLANDQRGTDPIAPATVAITTPPAFGTAVANPDGTITYTPNPIYNGPDSFAYTVRDTSSSGQPSAQTFLATNGPVRVHVPTSNALGETWRGGSESFDDSGWQSGALGVGYDLNPSPVDFNPYIGTNVQAMQNANTSIYMRSTFTLNDPGAVTALSLRIRYDDGFAAFLNGSQVASGNAPANLVYNSAAVVGTRTDSQAVAVETFNLTEFKSALRVGTNVLAIQGLNQGIGSSDLLMQPELIATVAPLGRVSNAATVSINVTGVDYPPIARTDSYQINEGQTLTVGSTGGGPTSQQSIIATGAIWRYRDNGIEPPADAQADTWKEHDYNDSAWASGPSELGYGDGGEATVVSCGPSQPSCNSNNQITTWFRRSFTLEPGIAPRIAQLAIEYQRDDGAAIYINGVEVIRNNLPGVLRDNTITPTTLASATVGNTEEGIYQSATLDLSQPSLQDLLREGENVVAVEIHQDRTDSTDISFDLRMTATVYNVIGLLANDTEPDGQPMTALLESQPANGTLNFNADGTFVYTPNAGFAGVDTFTYRASDGTLLSDPATVTITVQHTPPVAAADSYLINEDTQLVVAVEQGVLVNDRDTQNHLLSAVLVSPPAHGELSLNANGSFTYTPAANYNGVDTFTYRASDGSLQSGVTTVTITVAPTADAPVAHNDAFQTLEGQSLGGAPVDAGVVEWPLVAGGNGHFYLVVPFGNSASWTIADTTARAMGGHLATIASAAENNFVFQLVNNGQYWTNGIVGPWIGGVQQAGSVEPAGGWQWVTGEAFGYTNWAPGEPENGGGANRVHYTVSGSGQRSSFWNDSTTAPAAAPIAFVVEWDDIPILPAQLVTPTSAVASTGGNDHSPVINLINNSGLSAPLFGAASLHSPSTTAAWVTDGVGNPFDYFASRSPPVVTLGFDAVYPLTGAAFWNYSTVGGGSGNGARTVTVEFSTTGTSGAFGNPIVVSLSAALDGVSLAQVRPFGQTISANAVRLTFTDNYHPDSGGDRVALSEIKFMSATALPSGSVLANDIEVDGQTLSAVLASSPQHGTIDLRPNGAFHYVPQSGFVGTDSFTYRASDGTLLSDPATVTIIVNHTPPTAIADTYTTAEEVPLIVSSALGVLANDSDTQGHPLTAVLQTPPAHGGLSLSADGSFTYTPAANFHGLDVFTYRASDGALSSSVVTVEIDVLSVDDSPIAVDDTYTTLQGETLATQPPAPNYAEVVLSDLPLAYWRLGESPETNVAVDVVSGFNGQFIGGAMRGAPGAIVGDVDTAVDFNGAGRIDMGFRSALNLGNGFSIEAWISPDSVSGYRHFINTWNGPQGYGFGVRDGRLAFVTYGIREYETSTALVTPGRWYHLVVVFDTSNDAAFYLDGSLVQIVAGSSPANSSSQSFGIGATSVINDPANRAFDGRIDEVAFYNHLLSADDVRIHYAAGIGTSEIPESVPLIGRNATWKYRDNIANGAAYPVDLQGDRWNENDYDDAAWSSGAAILGYGIIDGGPVATTLSFGGNASDKLRTALFRRAFEIEDAARVLSLSFSLLVDDGAAIYINGREVRRQFMAGTVGDNGITTSTLAQPGDETNYTSFSIDPAAFPGLLVDGTNTIAVEVHQVDATSSDLGLDLSLSATVRPDPAASGVLANDSDGDGDELSAVVVSNPTHGALQFGIDGTFTYTPSAGFVGVDQFTYRATDGSLQSQTASVTIVVKSPTTLPEDLNADGTINAGDVAFLLASYGKASGGKSIEGDLDGDARIGIRDAIRLRNAFTPAPSPLAAAAIVARASDRAIVEAGSADLLRADRRVRRSGDNLSEIRQAATDQALAAIVETPSSFTGRRSRLLMRTRG